MTKKVKRHRGTTALLAAMFSLAGISASTPAPANESNVVANGTSNLVLDAGLHEIVGRAGSGAVTNLSSQFDEPVSEQAAVPKAEASTKAMSASTLAVESAPVAVFENEINLQNASSSLAPEESFVSAKKVSNDIAHDHVETPILLAQAKGSVPEFKIEEQVSQPKPAERSSFSSPIITKRVALVQPVRGLNRQVLDRLSQRGTVPRKTKYVYGRGERQDVVTALQVIVPTGWSAFSSDNGVKDAPLVTWREKGRPWTETLNKVLIQSGMRAIIDWDKKEIDIMVHVPDEDQPIIVHAHEEQEKVGLSQRYEKLEKQQTIITESSKNVPVVAKVADHVPAYSGVSEYGVRAVTPKAVKPVVEDPDLAIAKAAEAEILMALKVAKQSSAQAKSGSSLRLKRLASAHKPSVSTDLSAPKIQVTIVNDKVASDEDTDVKSIEREIESAEIASAKAAVIESQANKPKMLESYAQQGQVVTPKQAIKRYKATQLEGGSIPIAFAVRGSGYNIPLFTALGQVSPPGWFVYSKDTEITNKILVAWRGGNRPWLDVLDDILAANKLTARVNFKQSEIQIIASE